MDGEITGLEHLLKAFFNQDWPYNGPNAQAVLREYVRRNPRYEIELAHAGARELLERTPSEAELGSALDELGLEYDPAFEGRSHRQWLKLVIDALGSELRADCR